MLQNFPALASDTNLLTLKFLPGMDLISGPYTESYFIKSQVVFQGPNNNFMQRREFFKMKKLKLVSQD